MYNSAELNYEFGLIESVVIQFTQTLKRFYRISKEFCINLLCIFAFKLLFMLFKFSAWISELGCR